MGNNGRCFGGDSVAQALEFSKSYERVFFRPNPGNAGDSLINAGFYECAKSCGLDYIEIVGDFDYSSLRERDLVILSGGGNIVPYWQAGSDLIKELTQYNFPLMLMPQTVAGREDVLRLLRKEDVLFLRERFSFDYASSLDLKCKVLLDHDLAFSLRVGRVMERCFFPRLSTKNLRKLIYIFYHYVRSRFVAELKAFRTDRESIRPGRYRKINDISSLAKFGTGSADLNYCSSYWMLKILSWYKLVETDRLHVFVACVLLGKKVTLHSNSYYKNRGVYDHSISGDEMRSKNVDFVG